MKPTTVLFSAPAVLGLLLLTGCAVAQPMARSADAPVQGERPLSLFAAKRTAAAVEDKPALMAAAEPEPAPSPQAAEEPAPEPQPQAAAEPEPKKRGPLTRSEETEIDNQVMP